MVHLLQPMTQNWQLFIKRESSFHQGALFGVYSSTGFNKRIMLCIYHYIPYRLISLLKTPLLHLRHPPDNEPLAITDRLTVSGVWPLPECQIIRILRYVAFSAWLLSLGDVHLRFCHISSWLYRSFIFMSDWNILSILNDILLSTCASLYSHLLEDILAASKF